MSEILVITCPSGKQCSHLIPLLYNKGQFKLRLATHSKASQETLQEQYPDAECLKIDLTSLADCQTLMHGSTAAYVCHPSLHSREKEIGFNLIDAAVAEWQRPQNVFKHYVCSTVLSTQHRNLQQHDCKSYVEERLFLPPMHCWTIVKPTNFMDAYPVQLLASQEHPVCERFWTPEIPNSVIALRDLAEASAKILTEREKHFLAEYPLCSTMPVSDREVLNMIGKKIGKEVKTTAPSFDVGVDRILSILFGAKDPKYFANKGIGNFASANEGDIRGDLTRDGAERLVLFYSRRGLVGSPNVLRWLLGREPTTVEQWIDIQLGK